jgi:hypothetical protein
VPSAVLDAHTLIASRMQAALGNKYEFNEVLRWVILLRTLYRVVINL